MPTNTRQKSGVFKEWFDAGFYREVASDLDRAAPCFNRTRFLQITLEGLEQRELMDRLRQTSVAVDASLTGDFPAKLKVLRRIAKPQANGLIGCWYADFVAQFGRENPALSLPALAYFTEFGSAEFAIREFLIRDQDATLKVMGQWARDTDEHVRRLASEGSRPRLPWGKRLSSLVDDPTPTLTLLHELRDDPSLYVRKSVANHLNDIAKDHPAVVLDTVRQWDRQSPRTAWIIKQGLRTLIKQAHPEALAFMGVGQAARLDPVQFKVHPRRIQLGERITLSLQLTSTATSPQDLLIDYVVHYVKASEDTRAKVFKWTQTRLAPAASIELTKSQLIKDFTTRRHYPGPHRVEIQVNGQRLAQTTFQLDLPRP